MRAVRWLRFRSILSLLAGAMVLCGLPAAAQETESIVDSPLRFRRVYAPVDRLKDWPRGDVRYVPMSLAEFGRLAGTVASGAAGGGMSLAATLATAEYRARLEDNRLTDGEATIDVVFTGTAPARVALDPCVLAISESTWAAAKVGVPALAGGGIRGAKEQPPEGGTPTGGKAGVPALAGGGIRARKNNRLKAGLQPAARLESRL